MTPLPNGPRCGSAHTYEEGPVFVCPDCKIDGFGSMQLKSGFVKKA